MKNDTELFKQWQGRFANLTYGSSPHKNRGGHTGRPR